MYREGESMKLVNLKEKGFNPLTILDIGAHKGQFYNWAKNVWPDAFIWMIEANECHEKNLKNLTLNNKDRYTIATMGDIEREVNFYTRKDKPHTEGASYYKEANYWDIPQLVQESKIKLQKLDNIFEDGAIFELIKIDTQGSELDILKGGVELVSKASAIVLEVAYIEYNEGAPSVKEITDYMNKIGFEERMSIGEHYDGETVVQRDLLFTKV